MITLNVDGYERLMNLIRGHEKSARQAVLDPAKAHDHARESVAFAYQIRSTLSEVVTLNPPEKIEQDITGPESA